MRGLQNLRAAWLAGPCLLLGTGCSSSKLWEANRKDLDFALEQTESGDLQRLDARMGRLLVESEEDAEDFGLQRYYAAYLAAQAHTAGSLDRPFLNETTTSDSRIGGIGESSLREGPMDRASIHGHLVAAIFHASRASSLYEAAARSGPRHDGITLLPESLWNLGVDNAEANLKIILTTAYARLGFFDEVERILDRSPTLLELGSCLELFDRYQVQEKLRPWVCAMIFEYLKERDEEEAYRFGVVAVEGEERFGLKLPDDAVWAIDDWIVNGASVLFVCGESRTAYIPGSRKSPISGVAHIDYVAVPRPE